MAASLACPAVKMKKNYVLLKVGGLGELVFHLKKRACDLSNIKPFHRHFDNEKKLCPLIKCFSFCIFIANQNHDIVTLTMITMYVLS